jgi:hypothetical protein
MFLLFLGKHDGRGEILEENAIKTLNEMKV